MNVIVIMNDSLRRDHINAYGVPAPWERPGHSGEPFIDTPNLDRLAAQSAIFDRCYIASYPTIPNRRDLLTGRWGLIETGWEPLRAEDVLLPEVARKAGIVTQLFFDTLPMGSDGYGFRRGFDGWEWIRGQHNDFLDHRPQRPGALLPAPPDARRLCPHGAHPAQQRAAPLRARLYGPAHPGRGRGLAGG